MASVIEISDLNAPELAPYVALTEAQLRNKRHPEQGIFLAESAKVIRVALNAGLKPVSMLMDSRHLRGQGGQLAAQCGDIPVYTGSDALLKNLTGYQLNRGFLCAMERPKTQNPEEICRDASRIAVLEGLTDAANLGAVFRSAAALGMDAVILSPSCCDPLNRRTVRVSMGTVFQVPWARLGEDPSQWPGAGLERLHQMGFRTAALALTDRAVTIEDPGLMAEPRLAILLGTEGDGLQQATLDAADYVVQIPMAHGVDSLNVAAAAAVAFWQLRKRG